MGMQGSKTALEELTCRVLGDLVEEGVVAKVADDLYCGGNSPEELQQNFGRLLHLLHKSSLNLSASKTIIAPNQTTILGLIWRLGTLQANQHRIASLSSRDVPTTVTDLSLYMSVQSVKSCYIRLCHNTG